MTQTVKKYGKLPQTNDLEVGETILDTIYKRFPNDREMRQIYIDIYYPELRRARSKSSTEN